MLSTANIGWGLAAGVPGGDGVELGDGPSVEGSAEGDASELPDGVTPEPDGASAAWHEAPTIPTSRRTKNSRLRMPAA
jgi:hypothetical protein